MMLNVCAFLIQEKNIITSNSEERVGFLTRQSPKPPDTNTLIIALSSLAVAILIYVVVQKVKKRRISIGFKPLVIALTTASFLWFAYFLFAGMGATLFSKSNTITREESYWPTERGKEDLESALREMDRFLPKRCGIMLVNCTSPSQVRLAETINYFLYPRKIVYKRQSSFRIEDPKKAFTPEILAYLETIGVSWLLDLDKMTRKPDLKTTLIPVPSSLEGDK